MAACSLIILETMTSNTSGIPSPKATNIVWHQASVDRNSRFQQRGHKSAILWFTGLSGSGKTSIARSLLKNIVGQTSAKIGTTKQINSYKIRIPILKRNINYKLNIMMNLILNLTLI